MGKNKRKDRPLSGLADALLKAGIVDEQRAAKADREHRRTKRELGAQGVARLEAEKQAEFERKRKQEAEQARERERGRLGSDGVERVRGLLRSHRESAPGNRRWFFVARDGRVPFLEVADRVDKLLAQGEAGIVESMGTRNEQHIVISDPDALASIRDFDPELIRLWNSGGGPS